MQIIFYVLSALTCGAVAILKGVSYLIIDVIDKISLGLISFDVSPLNYFDFFNPIPSMGWLANLTVLMVFFSVASLTVICFWIMVFMFWLEMRQEYVGESNDKENR